MAQENFDVKIFEVDGKKYKAIKPTNKIRRESDAIYAKSFREALSSGFFLQAEIDETLETKGYTDKTTNQKRNELNRKIRDLEVKLVKGAYKELNEGKNIAHQIQDLRDELNSIESSRQELEALSVERQAENARINFFACKCCFTEDNKPVWNNQVEFENDETPLAMRAAAELLLMIYNTVMQNQKEVQANRTEIRWLKDQGLIDGDFNYVDSAGRRVDREGRLINDKGEFINDAGQRVDIYGNLLDENGNLIGEQRQEKPIKKSKKQETPV